MGRVHIRSAARGKVGDDAWMCNVSLYSFVVYCVFIVSNVHVSCRATEEVINLR